MKNLTKGISNLSLLAKRISNFSYNGETRDFIGRYSNGK
jgi:hypothetical protein